MNIDELYNVLDSLLDKSNAGFLKYDLIRQDKKTQFKGPSRFVGITYYTKTEVYNVLKLYNNTDYRIWQIANAVDLSYDSVVEILEFKKLNYRERVDNVIIEDEMRVLSSPIRLFDGTANIKYDLMKRGYSNEDICKKCCIPILRLEQLFRGTAVPSPDEIHKMSEILDKEETIKKWKATSRDMYALWNMQIGPDVYHAKGPLTITALSNEQLGPWGETKRIAVRSLLANLRLTSSLDQRQLMSILGYNKTVKEYFLAETAQLLIPLKAAKIIAANANLKNWQDVYIVEMLPVNYSYQFKQQLKFLKGLEEHL